MSKKQRTEAVEKWEEYTPKLAAARERRAKNDDAEPSSTGRPLPAAEKSPVAEPIPAMPTLAQVTDHHREHTYVDPVHWYGMVTTVIKANEVQQIPAAKAAVQAEWDKLTKARCWILESVQEYETVRKNAIRDNRTAHFGRVFSLCGVKHSELPPEKRKYKGRIVFQGNNVKDELGYAAVFTDQGSSASFLAASKLLDVVSMLPGCDGGQSDAPQAYTQALLYNGEDDEVETWIFLPRDQWPRKWATTYKRPVVRLRLALYGHPLSGLFWEKHYRKELLQLGFVPMDGWESCFVHKELGLILSIYVDDFKLAGKAENLQKGWDLIRKAIRLDDPTPFSDYLGCGQHNITLSPQEIDERLGSILPLLEDASGHSREEKSLARVTFAAVPSLIQNGTICKDFYNNALIDISNLHKWMRLH